MCELSQSIFVLQMPTMHPHEPLMGNGSGAGALRGAGAFLCFGLPASGGFLGRLGNILHFKVIFY